MAATWHDGVLADALCSKVEAKRKLLLESLSKSEVHLIACFMYAQGTLNDREKEEICASSTRTGAINCLLDTIEKRGDYCAGNFLQALSSDMLERRDLVGEIRNSIKVEPTGNHATHAATLRAKVKATRQRLLQCLSKTEASAIASIMYGQGVITRETHAQITGYSTAADAVGCLLNAVERTGEACAETFLLALYAETVERSDLANEIHAGIASPPSDSQEMNARTLCAKIAVSRQRLAQCLHKHDVSCITTIMYMQGVITEETREEISEWSTSAEDAVLRLLNVIEQRGEASAEAFLLALYSEEVDRPDLASQIHAAII